MEKNQKITLFTYSQQELIELKDNRQYILKFIMKNQNADLVILNLEDIFWTENEDNYYISIQNRIF